MPRIISVFLLSLIFLTLFSCAGQRKTDPMLYAGRTISLGSGGGFTGIEKQYRLLDNGQLYFRTSRDTSFTMVDAKTTKLTKSWFSKFDSLGLGKTDFNQPGNMYRFIEKPDGKRIVWGSNNTVPDKKIIQFYEGFINYWIPLKKAGQPKN